MNDEQIYEEYMTIDGINSRKDYFFNLSLDERIILFNQLSYEELRDLVNSLSLIELKDFFIGLDVEKETQNKLCNLLSESQITALYRNLNSDAQKKLSTILTDLHISLEVEKNNLSEEIETSYKNISENNTKIVQSSQKIENTRAEIENNKQTLKDVNKQIKKLDKERKKRLRRQLRASKPRKIDRIAIISKYRTRKLEQRTEELNQTIAELNQKQNERDIIEINNENLRETIEQERNNIEQLKDDLKFEASRIKENNKRIRNLDVRVKKLSHSEKKILGRKLHKQQLSEIDRVLVTRKKDKLQNQAVNNNSTSQNSVNQPPVTTEVEAHVEAPVSAGIPENTEEQVNERTNNEENGKINMQQAIQELLKFLESMQQLGVNFNPNTNPLDTTQNADLANNPITTTNNMQTLLAGYVMGMLVPQIKQNQQNQQLPASHSRGFVNLSLLLSVILFLFSLVLFFIK